MLRGGPSGLQARQHLPPSGCCTCHRLWLKWKRVGMELPPALNSKVVQVSLMLLVLLLDMFGLLDPQISFCDEDWWSTYFTLLSCWVPNVTLRTSTPPGATNTQDMCFCHHGRLTVSVHPIPTSPSATKNPLGSTSLLNSWNSIWWKQKNPPLVDHVLSGRSWIFNCKLRLLKSKIFDLAPKHPDPIPVITWVSPPDKLMYTELLSSPLATQNWTCDQTLGAHNLLVTSITSIKQWKWLLCHPVFPVACWRGFPLNTTPQKPWQCINYVPSGELT